MAKKKSHFLRGKFVVLDAFNSPIVFSIDTNGDNCFRGRNQYSLAKRIKMYKRYRIDTDASKNLSLKQIKKAFPKPISKNSRYAGWEKIQKAIQVLEDKEKGAVLQPA